MSKKKPQITAESQKGQGIPNWSEDQARDYFESRRWADGQPICHHCGSVNTYRLQGKSHRLGLLECKDCRKQFTVTMGSIMEDSHLPLSVWARAFHFMSTSKKGFSALQLQRNLGLGSYRTAWFLCHRIREAMKPKKPGLLKGTVQVDETYVGGKPRPEHGKPKSKRGRGTEKTPVMVAVETGGNAKAHVMERVDSASIKTALQETADKGADIVTDEYPAYGRAAWQFNSHQRVNHSKGEFVGRHGETTNTAESYFALLKRGHYGTYHSMSEKYMDRYCDEFDFRWNGRTLTDVERRDAAVDGAEGKRLTYKKLVPKNDAA